MIIFLLIVTILALNGCMVTPTDPTQITMYNDKLLNFYGQLLAAGVNVVGLIIGLMVLNKKAAARTQETIKTIEEYKGTVTDATGEALKEYHAMQKAIDEKIQATQLLIAQKVDKPRQVRATDLLNQRKISQEEDTK